MTNREFDESYPGLNVALFSALTECDGLTDSDDPAVETVGHLRAALVSSHYGDSDRVVDAVQLAAESARTADQPTVQTDIANARVADPLSADTRYHIRQALQRLIAVVNLWEVSA